MRPGHTCIVLFVVFLLVSFLFFHKPFPFGQDLVLMKTGIVQLIAYVPQTRVIPRRRASSPPESAEHGLNTSSPRKFSLAKWLRTSSSVNFGYLSQIVLMTVPPRRSCCCSNTDGFAPAPKRTVPACGRSLPSSTRSNVDFPAPFGPAMTRRSPRFTSRSNPSTSLLPPSVTEIFFAVRISL